LGCQLVLIGGLRFVTHRVVENLVHLSAL
jgi:hypothetical protein